MKRTAIIIGAGIGGICTGIRLAREGLDVTVIEKNNKPGGRCDRIERDGHRFDSGPTLLVMPHIYEAELESLGANIHEVLDLRRVDPTYHLVFDDGTRLELTSDMTEMQERLEAIEPGAFAGLLRYLEEGYHHYRVSLDRLVYRDFRGLADLVNLQNVPLLFQIKPFANHYDNMTHYFHSPRLKAAFTFQDVYMGLSPFEAPATFSMMAYTELTHGVWYPQGGMYAIVEALMKLAHEAGVNFMFETAAEQIIIEHDLAQGVAIEGGRHMAADLVVANADLPYVYHELLPPDEDAIEKFAEMRFSCSTLSFFWGIDCRLDQLGPHTLFLADDYEANFDAIIDKLTLADNPSLYVHAPSRLNPEMAPTGQDTLIAVVPVGHLSGNGEQDWTALRDGAREHVFRRLALLGIADLQQHIKFEMSFNPLSWRKRYNLMKGSTHGLCHNLTQLAWFRPDLRHESYHNLYFVGASTRPGTGIPTAMVSSRLVAGRIMDDIRQISAN